MLSAGYLLLAYAGPVYQRFVSRRGYSTIDDTATATATHETLEGDSAGGGTGSTSVQLDGASAVTGGSFGRPQQQGKVAGAGREGGGRDSGLLGRGWRAYGSTDEPSAGAGCLPSTGR